MHYYIAGLGNPGAQYIKTRHNAGREIVLNAQSKWPNFSDWKKHSKIDLIFSEGECFDQQVTLLLPETFMNISGPALKKYISVLNEQTHLIVVHDDIDLPFGTIKISYDRNSGGHNGVESVINTFGTKEFVRLRVGILPLDQNGSAAKPENEEVSDFVLGKFSLEESSKLPEIYSRTKQALEKIISDGYVEAMNTFN